MIGAVLLIGGPWFAISCCLIATVILESDPARWPDILRSASSEELDELAKAAAHDLTMALIWPLVLVFHLLAWTYRLLLAVVLRRKLQRS